MCSHSQLSPVTLFKPRNRAPNQTEPIKTETKEPPQHQISWRLGFTTCKLERSAVISALSYTLLELFCHRNWLYGQAQLQPMRTKKREHITPVLMTLHRLPVCFGIDFKVLFITYKALHDVDPPRIYNRTAVLLPTSTQPEILRQDHTSRLKGTEHLLFGLLGFGRTWLKESV